LLVAFDACKQGLFTLMARSQQGNALLTEQFVILCDLTIFLIWLFDDEKTAGRLG